MPIGQLDFNCTGMLADSTALRERLRKAVLDAGVGGALRWVDREQDALALPGANIDARTVGPRDRKLVECYLDFMAPQLLTLPTLARDERARLEQAAVKRPMLLARLHRLIPEFVDRAVINVALVEAALRRGV
ncbi:MAG: hypothetical protein ACPGU7_01865 [Gammaproteobacteria bacterium]